MANANLTSSILYTDDSRSVILLDIPKSIADAQGFQDDAHIVSCHPLTQPYQTNEPKTGETKQRIANFSPDQTLHNEISQLLESVLQHLCEVRGADKPYCLPRKTNESLVRTRWLKRKASHIGNQQPKDEDPDQTPSEKCLSSAGTPSLESTLTSDELQLCDDRGNCDSFDGLYLNHSGEARLVHFAPSLNTKESRYRIPVDSCFLLAKCEDSAKFRTAAKYYAQGLSGKGRFDAIVMDPPWPNLSAKRKGSYARAADQSTIFDLLASIDLDIHIAPGGIVAVWITNNPKVRESILGCGGLFEVWGIELREEWIWLKITSNGEPVTPVDGLWRKPYEIVLVGKAPTNRYNEQQPPGLDPTTRRVIVAVPDLHSRKPCLKPLLEETLIKDAARDYRALEIFARHLVQGWMSWGDEVLKFNETDQWR